MNTEQQQAFANAKNTYWWARMRRVYPTLPIEPPPILLNNRLKTTAGRAWLDRFITDVSVELLVEYPEHFANDTIPHELAHHVAFLIFKDEGHGKGWKEVCRRVGVNTSRTHQMVNSVHAARKAGVR